MTTTAATLSAELLQTVTDSLAPDAGDFVGREFVRSEIEQFLATRNRMLVIVGPPGVGKTALAAALFREQINIAQPYLAHFCGLHGGDNPFTFCSSLAEQLQAHLGDAYTLPETARRQQVIIKTTQQVGTAMDHARITGVQLTVGGMHPREAFRQLVREPLRAYDQAHGTEHRDAPLVILVDALDRAWEWDGGQAGNIVSILADVQELPPWVNLICTGRPGPAVQALRAHAGVQVYDLDPKSKENLADIETFFRDCFLARLGPTRRARFDELLIEVGFASNKTDDERASLFVRRATEASQGIFRYVRRYVDAWGSALQPDAAAPGTAQALLRFDGGDSLAGALDATYAAILTGLRRELDANPNDADEDVLATLAIAFAPLNLRLLSSLAARTEDEVADSLGRLAPVLKASSEDRDQATFALYHRGFAEYVRRRLPAEGRRRDVRASQVLEQSDADDALARDYSARHRWLHLLRGLDLGAAARAAPPAGQPIIPRIAALAHTFNGVAEVQAQVPDALTQAQVLRWLAARALDPAQSDATGSWAAALDCLQAAERALRRTRALTQLKRQGWRIAEVGHVPAELIELERTLMAQGDAYATIAQRMDAGGRQLGQKEDRGSRLYNLLEAITRIPLVLYMVQVVLRLQRLREIEFPGILQNLGRDRDWTVARLYVQSVSAYRRARWLARLHGAGEMADDVTEHLARVYVLIGAYSAATKTYETLLARPATLRSRWRQAVWRLELGEVLLGQDHADRAVEALNSAIPVFEAQQAPVHRARARSALAVAHRLQANAASTRGDHARAATPDDLAVADFSAALDAWRDVTTLAGDGSASVDPELAISRTAHHLWHAARDPRLGDEQHRQLRALLDTIPERHFPQRFEHPVLRLFRLVAMILLPIFVLLGLLLAVQLPSKIQIGTRTDLTFQPPLLDLAGFPENVNRTAGLTLSEIAHLAPRNVALDLQTTAPALDPLAVTWIVLLFVGLYLCLYTLVGVGVIATSSPTQFQDRRPGRLILGPTSLTVTRPIGEGSLREAQIWFWQDIRTLFARIQHRLTRHTPHRPPPSAAPDTTAAVMLPLSDISSMIVVNRRLFGKLLPDFSFTLAQMRQINRKPLLIQGSVVHYEELCDELERRSDVPYHSFGVEFMRGFWGFCFSLTLLYALLLVILLPLTPGMLVTPLPGLGFSLSHLYVLATPGLILPLLWWFIAHPLGAHRARSSILPLLMTAVAGFALTVAVVGGEFSLLATRLRPDLASPLLATGLLAALLVYAPSRVAESLRPSIWSRLGWTALALLATAGLLLLALHIGGILQWYYGLVHGNLEVQRALPGGADPCRPDREQCPAVERAIKQYGDAVRQRPHDSDGYAFRGFAHLVKGQHRQARSDFLALRGAEHEEHLAIAREEYRQAACDFQAALGVESFGHDHVPSACPIVTGVSPTREQQASLYANLGTVQALLARDRPFPEAEQHYQQAVGHFAQALDLLGARPVTSTVVPTLTSCYDLARKLLAPEAIERAGYRLDVLADEGNTTLNTTQRRYVLQLADTCYRRAFARFRAISTVPLPKRAAESQAVWEDLAAAIAEYRAVRAAPGQGEERWVLAQRGLAAAWLLLSELEPRPPEAPTRRTALLRTEATYQALLEAGQRDEAIYAGHGWTAIQLGAWDQARGPLAAAAELAPDDPTYPALQGLAAWLNSTRYPTAQFPGAFASTINDALEAYTRVIALGQGDLSRTYATRSLMYFNLRTIPRGETFAAADFDARMLAAIADMDQALIEAERLHLAPSEQAGYRFWRGRLSMSLALNWQVKKYDVHEWSELVPYYSQAYDDFTAGVRVDLNSTRRERYQTVWQPWARHMLANATHMALAYSLARENNFRTGDFSGASAELAMVEPEERTFSGGGIVGVAPALRPDYSFLHGLVSLGLVRPTEAEASYDQAIEDTEDPKIVPTAQRAAVYRVALADLERLLANPWPGWSDTLARPAAERVRAKLLEHLAAAEALGD